MESSICERMHSGIGTMDSGIELVATYLAVHQQVRNVEIAIVHVSVVLLNGCDVVQLQECTEGERMISC